MKHFLRITALLLAVLLVALPPLQASAAAISGTAVMIGLGAAAVVSSIMIGLGVMPGSDRSAFNTIVQSCTESSSVGAYIRDGLIDVLRYKNSGGAVRYGVLQNLIEAVRGWLWNSRTIVNDISPNTFSCTVTSNSKSYNFSSDVPFDYFFVNDAANSDLILVFIADSAFFLTHDVFSTSNGSSSTSVSLGDLGNYHYVRLKFGSKIHVSFSCQEFFPSGFSMTTILKEYVLSNISTSSDLTLGTVSPSNSDIVSSHADWSAGSIALPHPGIDIPGVDEGTDEGTGEDTGEGEEEGEEEGEKKLVYWPTGILNPATDTTDVLTQENVIAGTGTLDDTLTGDITGPIVGGITGDITLEDTPAIPGEGEDVGTGEGEGTGDIVYPTDIPTYSLDLREFFPFCIPFDIYEFLSILAADPVAPVFEWSIPVPQLGETFDLEVDLSAWDNVARLFRNLELLAFIVGLAMVTRDKFIRS